jgi:hypothetical protein
MLVLQGVHMPITVRADHAPGERIVAKVKRPSWQQFLVY